MANDLVTIFDTEVAIRSLIVPAFFLLAPSMVQADVVTYNMTGTIMTVFDNVGNLPIHAGDRIGWTLQYDRSLPQMPGTSIPGNPMTTYSATTSPLLNLVDLTSHTPLPSPEGISPGALSYPSYVVNYSPGSATTGIPMFNATAMWMRSSDGLFGSATLGLQINSNNSVNSVLAAKDLAHLQLDTVPFDFRSLLYEYQLPPTTQPALKFAVKVDPLSGSISSTPEPSSLLLLSLGSAGLTFLCMRDRRRKSTLLARSS